jgi:isoleucyl-tRNA synthetase
MTHLTRGVCYVVFYAERASGCFVCRGFGDVTVGVAAAQGCKCERCWNFAARVGECAAHPTLCERCVPVILTKKVPVAAQS